MSEGTEQISYLLYKNATFPLKNILAFLFYLENFPLSLVQNRGERASLTSGK